MKNNQPINFWGIGAQKAGTSWLYYNLSKTPGFSIPPVKEFHYFDRNTKYLSPNFLSKSKVKDRIFSLSYLERAGRAIFSSIFRGNFQNVGFFLRWYFSNYNDEWYKSIFNRYSGTKGEITPSYSMLNKEDVSRMYALSPNAKLIFMLRNPVDRAWSHFRHIKKKIKGFTLDDVTEKEIIEFIEGEGQELRSNYLRTIENFSSVFPKEQILLGFYDAIIESPEQLLEEVIQFITTGKETNEGFKESLKGDDSPTKEIVNKSIELDCPPLVLNLLKEKYHDMILELANQYGGYFNKWYSETYGKPSGSGENKLFCTIHLK
ncbi:sulfotransferase domain-containing protein [Maribacter sp. 4G9]|uniref:sulfotransferase domain-containing protein n=1 Tax=Maribacter sp. 4G9 TaxID=1889777 RepID=UPI000C15AE24|nr:sulfotransferase domain-containing protein [Maribacter sp. 4G9]PIB23021.1 hypothetical protein BFP75_10995 [Maribacter sp. 4G9]